MLTVSQLIERTAHCQLRRKVRMSLQPGTLSSVVAQEMNAVIVESLNAQLAAERDLALSRAPYERAEGSAKRNGFKPVRLMGFFGEMWLRRPVVRAGSLKLPLLDALKSAGTRLRDVLASRFWLRGTATRAVAEELHSALGARMSASTVSTLTNALEPTIRAWETSTIPEGIHYLFLDALYLPVRRPGFTSEQALLLALGVDGDGRRPQLEGGPGRLPPHLLGAEPRRGRAGAGRLREPLERGLSDGGRPCHAPLRGPHPLLCRAGKVLDPASLHEPHRTLQPRASPSAQSRRCHALGARGRQARLVRC